MKLRLELGNLMPQLDAKVRDGVHRACKEEGVETDKAFVERSVHAEKAFVGELDAGSRAAVKYVSTRSCDAEGDLVVPKGIVLTEFLKNPVFFWGHNYSLPPLGSDELVQADDHGLKVKSVYGDTGPGTMADVVWKLVQQGHQKQSSIGYVPLHATRRTDNGFQGELDVFQKSWPELKDSRTQVKRILHKVLMLEHSDVGLGMNRDTTVLQVAKGFGASDLLFKQMGLEFVEADVEEMKPYPNEHAARLNDPGKYEKVRRENDKFGPGIHAIFGVTKEGKAEVQAIRFDRAKHTPAEARKWLKDHKHSPILFEKATGEEKGDEPSHPFRGNQYSSGEGGGGGESEGGETSGGASAERVSGIMRDLNRSTGAGDRAALVERVQAERVAIRDSGHPKSEELESLLGSAERGIENADMESAKNDLRQVANMLQRRSKGMPTKAAGDGAATDALPDAATDGATCECPKCGKKAKRVGESCSAMECADCKVALGEPKAEKPPEEEKGFPTPFEAHGTAPANMVWKAARETNGAAPDELELMAAYQRYGDPELKSTYLFPHHRVMDMRAVWGGVREAMAYLLGARGGVEIPPEHRKAVHAHLARHYAEFGAEPPELRDYTQGELRELFPDLYESKGYVRKLYVAEAVVKPATPKFVREVRSMESLVKEALELRMGRV